MLIIGPSKIDQFWLFGEVVLIDIRIVESA